MADLNIEDLTGGGKAEAGIFEELMRTVKSHLSEEYSAGRIDGDNYTKAYIASMNAAMSVGTQYLLQHGVVNQQIKLIESQIQTQNQQTALIQEQVDQIVAQTAYTEKQTLKLDSDIALVDEQIKVQAKQQLVLDEQVTNLQKDIESKDSAITLNTKQGALVDQNAANALTSNSQIIAQTDKLTAEKNVLEQRRISEEAQVKDNVDGLPVGGVIGKQMKLYENQAEGYIRDAEQKAAKIMADNLITRISTNYDNTSHPAAGFDDSADIEPVMNKLKAGINVT